MPARISILACFLLGGCAPAVGVGVCGLTGGPASDPCGPAPVSLSAEACRCGAHYYWDGTTCTATAACHCYSGCDHLYESAADCAAAHATCTDAGTTVDGG